MMADRLSAPQKKVAHETLNKLKHADLDSSVRADPKTVTAGPIRDITSKPSTNSAMMRNTRHVSSAACAVVSSLSRVIIVPLPDLDSLCCLPSYEPR